MSNNMNQQANSPRRQDLISRRHLLRAGAAAGALMVLDLPGSSRAQAQESGLLRVAVSANPSTLDPATGRSGADHQFLYPLFDTLVQWDPKTLEPRPGLAKSWEYSDDTTVVLELRPGLVFHDGTPLDSEAVKFNLDRVRTDEKSNIKIDLSSVASVETSGPTKVILKLKGPDRSIPLILTDRSGMMVSPTALKEGGGNVDRKPVGAGPWKFVKWDDNSIVSYERNPNYWNKGLPKTARLDMKIITEVSTGLRSVVAGENDLVVNVPPVQKVQLDRANKLQVLSMPSLYLFMVYLDFSKPPFDDVRVRQAMNLAIDRDVFNKVTLAGLGEPATTCYPKSYWPFDPAVQKLLAYDPDKARALLKEAGLSNVSFTSVGYSDQAAVQRQEVLIDMWRKVGFDPQLRTASVAEGSAMFFFQRKVDTFIAAITSRPDPSMVPYTIFGKSSPYNGGRKEIPGMEEALAESRNGSSNEVRKTGLSKVQRIACEQAVYVPLVFDANVTAMSKKLTGFEPNMLGRPRYESVSMA